MLNGEDTGLCNEETSCEIIMDSGASLMATPPNMYSEFINKVSEFADCDEPMNFPKIEFVIDDKNYSIDPFEYVLNDDNEISYSDYTSMNGLCSIGFSIFDVGDINVWIAGDIFLTKYLSIYDRDNNQVGLAEVARDVKKTETS